MGLFLRVLCGEMLFSITSLSAFHHRVHEEKIPSEWDYQPQRLSHKILGVFRALLGWLSRR
jgi:hypothetical protein